MTSMIDIVFLLLVFFLAAPVLSADEGCLMARLPLSGVDRERPVVPEAVTVRLEESGPRGDGVRVVLDGRLALGQNFAGLRAALGRRLERGLAPDHPVRIAPTAGVRHGWVVRAWDSALAAGCRRVEFAVPGPRIDAGPGASEKDGQDELGAR